MLNYSGDDYDYDVMWNILSWEMKKLQTYPKVADTLCIRSDHISYRHLQHNDDV